MPDYIIEGDQVGFTPLKADYLEHYQRWVNNLQVGQFISMFSQIVTEEEEQQWYEEETKSDDRVFTIHFLPQDKPIGNCGLHNINQQDRRAMMGILLGEKKYWNRGLGTESVTLLTDFGFSVLNLHTIYLTLKGFNRRAKRVYEKVGYRCAGRIRDFWLIDGKYHDQIIMDILREQFYEQNEPLIRDRYLTGIDTESDKSD